MPEIIMNKENEINKRKGFQIIGDIVLIKLSGNKNEKRNVALRILEKLPYVKTVCEIKAVEGEFRRPKTRILASREKHPDFVAIKKEHGIFYKLDVRNIMFSKGNLLERQRLIKHIHSGEVVLDMFAGIGYFSLGIGKLSPVKKVYAVEKNKMAYKFLKENIRLNKVRNNRPILGDCRRVKNKIKADRIIMGYLPNTQQYLPYAFKYLKKRGVIHYHNIYKEEELWKKPLEELENAAKKKGFKLVSVFNRKIKSYAPRIYHVVIDAEFFKN